MSPHSLFRGTCLKPSYSLRQQLLLSFGSTALIALTIVVAMAVICSNIAGNIVTSRSGQGLTEQVKTRLVKDSRFVAESLSSYMQNLEGTVQLMAEVVKDRIVGFPEAGWQEDKFVPFRDRDTGTNKYPLKSPSLRMDFEIDRNINENNSFEHVQERDVWVPFLPPVSSANASFFMQGVCDPSVADPGALTYYVNCSVANNDVETGGVIQPTSTNKGLYEKAGDIGILLKPLFESQAEILRAGVYFVNSGAGSLVHFPGNVRNGSLAPYTSLGCEWMRQINPRTGKPFGTDDDVARCHPAGTKVPQREYNPLERGWFPEFALNPGITWYGPFLSNDDSSLPLVSIGRAVVDRRTGNLIGCVAVDIAYTDMNKFLTLHKIHDESEVSIVRLRDDTVFGDTIDAALPYPIHVTETDIISAENYFKLKSAFDMKTNWTSGSVVYEVIVGDNAVYTANVLPFPPDEYDPDYKPEFMIIHAISNDVFAVVERMKDEIDSEVLRMSLLAIGVGLVGMCMVVFIVWFVSRTLTQPLLWIERVAWGIVNHADEQAERSFGRVSEGEELQTAGTCVPSTEISKLVSEFRAMITGFSGSGASTVAQSDLHEIKNEITWQSDYQQLYSDAAAIVTKSEGMLFCNDDDNSGEIGWSKNPTISQSAAQLETAKQSDEIGNSLIVPAPRKRNIGRNVVALPGEMDKKSIKNEFGDRKMPAYRSSLFWWILVLIALPLVLTNAAICAVVSFNIVDTFPAWHYVVAEASVKIEIEALQSVTCLKAKQAEMSIQNVVRDLHFITRVAGWLLFDGIARSDSFCHIDEGTQECRNFPADRSCPFFENPNRAACACEWEDLNALPCIDYTDVDSRSLQTLFFMSQARDADTSTGNRNASSSFGIGIDDSPNTTLWWDNIDELPGAEKGSNSSGFETAYDRLRVSAATSIALIPVYNYATAFNKKKQELTEALAFEADGLFMGFSGCSHQNTFGAHFESTTENMATIVAPNLCPEGKFGYDPRCRDWYARGKNLYEQMGQPVDITAPYLFGLEGSDFVAASATSPVANPATGKYAGQTIIDFYPSAVRNLLDSLTDRVSFVITPEDDLYGGNTVVGPNRSMGWESAPIANLVLSHDDPASAQRAVFESSILPSMRNGTRGLKKFSRMNSQGNEETLTLAFEPVYARVLLALDPSDFSRGANLSKILVYIVGIAALEDSIHAPCRTISDDLNKDLRRLIVIYISIVCFVSLGLMIITYKIALLVTEPMITLLTVVETINAGMIGADIPPLHGGSREVHQVYNSFAKLYKIVRISNVAYFSGNLTWAYCFICDALKLFRKIGDDKAIGIACNNLGNTLHAICADARYTGKCHTALPGVCVAKAAKEHYNEAIEIAQRQLEQALTEESKALFTIQLSDRLFNRGLFLLLVANGECAPAEAKNRGLEDIKKVRELDDDVSQFLLDRKLLLSRSADFFLRLLRRAFGLLDFYDDQDVRAVWDANDIVAEADRLLFAAWNQSTAPLFKELNPVGRLQQLEAAAIQLDLCRGRVKDASRLAMRMFAEDSFLIDKTFAMAATALMSLMRDNEEFGTWTLKTKSTARSDFRKMLRGCKQVSVDIGKCFVIAVEINERWEGDHLLEKVNESTLRLYDDCCLEDDYVGLVAYTTRGDLNVPLSVKKNNEGILRTNLDLATTWTSERVCPSFPYSIQLLVDSSTDTDSYILFLTDGYSWDSSSHLPVKLQIERLNHERDTKIHIIIFGMDVEEDNVVDECKLMCTVSKASFFMNINLSNVDSAFASVGRLLRGETSSDVVLKGITMEKF